MLWWKDEIVTDPYTNIGNFYSCKAIPLWKKFIFILTTPILLAIIAGLLFVVILYTLIQATFLVVGLLIITLIHIIITPIRKYYSYENKKYQDKDTILYAI